MTEGTNVVLIVVAIGVVLIIAGVIVDWVLHRKDD